MEVRLTRGDLCCVVCFLFPIAVMAMTLTYEQDGGWGEPGPFPYSAVDYVLYANLFYTTILILLMRGRRIMTAVVSIPLLAVTAWMVLLASMWFSGNYL